MIWLIVCAVILALAVGWVVCRRYRTPDRSTYQVVVALHIIRRRLDVSQFKVELRRDAANLRRQMQAELRRLDERENS
jgi:hypothetical protein